MADEPKDRSTAEEGDGDATARRTLTGISPTAWEHPADRAALNALRKLPAFDTVLKKLFGVFGEKPVRLAFQANALRVTERQFPRVRELYDESCRTLDVDPDAYPLFISQTPIVNAGAFGMENPFIVLNSGTIRLLDDDELSYVLGHEVGHILSDHVLYRTMMVLLIRLADMGYPIVGWAARAVLTALLEWYRKSELSSDRAGLLTVQDPEVAMRAMMKLAGGGDARETDLDEFIRQAEEYRESGDVVDAVFKVLNLLGTTHPFYVLRVSELREWIESGAYDRILRGDYPTRDDDARPYREDVKDAARAYAEGARGFLEDLEGAARKMRDRIFEGLGAPEAGPGPPPGE